MAFSSLSRKCGLNISAIILARKEGRTNDYDVLVAELMKSNVEEKLVVDVLKKSRECISEIDRDCEYLIGAILGVDWTHGEGRLIIEYQAFILNLVSAHICYLKPCLRMIVKKFIAAPREETLTADRVLSDGRSFVNVHSLLKSVAQLVPMVASVLVPLISENYPYLGKEAYVHEYYVRNILQVCQYLPDSRRDLLSLLVSKFLELDTRASREDIHAGMQVAEHETDTDTEDFFNMDCGEMDYDKPMDHVTANKLDICMNLLLEYIHSICYSNGELDWESTKKLYKELLTVFDTVIIQTFSSAHVQFIIFYICSFHRGLSDGFVDYLWKRVRDLNQQSVFRQAAVSYLASYLSRAKYLPITTVVTSMELMSGWIHDYLRQTSSSTLCDVTRHGPFYSVCQALFYVFIFRHREILNLRKGHQICLKFNFGTIATCRLNPLKVCLPMVAQTFSGITRMYQLAYCDAILERNARSVLPVTSLNSKVNSKNTRTNQLDSFFPFDPYLLIRSRRFVEPLYQEFGGVPLPEEESASEDDDDFPADNDHNFDVDVMTSTKHSLATSPSDFLMYSTSPGFKHQ